MFVSVNSEVVQAAKHYKTNKMTSINSFSIFVIELFIVIHTIIVPSWQHGRMMEPPARNVLWRMGYNATPNYEDSELFCGGIQVSIHSLTQDFALIKISSQNQWETNKGKCGVCGDSYSQKRPRPYEAGGKLATLVSTKIYAPGSQIDVIIDLVANHLGNFEFSLCPKNKLDEIGKTS